MELSGEKHLSPPAPTAPHRVCKTKTLWSDSRVETECSIMAAVVRYAAARNVFLEIKH